MQVSQAGDPLPSLRQMPLIRHWTRRRKRSHPPLLLFLTSALYRRRRGGHLNHAPVRHHRRPWQFSSRCASHDAMIQQFAAMMETMFVSLFCTRSLLFLGMCICLTFLRILITSAHLGVTSSSHCHFDYARTLLASNAGRLMGTRDLRLYFPLLPPIDNGGDEMRERASGPRKSRFTTTVVRSVQKKYSLPFSFFPLLRHRRTRTLARSLTHWDPQTLLGRGTAGCGVGQRDAKLLWFWRCN